MAYITGVFCQECKQTKQMAVGSGQSPTICNECVKEIEEFRVQAIIDELKKLSTEERLELLERWVAGYTPPIPLSELRF